MRELPVQGCRANVSPPCLTVSSHRNALLIGQASEDRCSEKVARKLPRRSATDHPRSHHHRVYAARPHFCPQGYIFPACQKAAFLARTGVQTMPSSRPCFGAQPSPRKAVCSRHSQVVSRPATRDERRKTQREQAWNEEDATEHLSPGVDKERRISRRHCLPDDRRQTTRSPLTLVPRDRQREATRDALPLKRDIHRRVSEATLCDWQTSRDREGAGREPPTISPLHPLHRPTRTPISQLQPSPPDIGHGEAGRVEREPPLKPTL